MDEANEARLGSGRGYEACLSSGRGNEARLGSGRGYEACLSSGRGYEARVPGTNMARIFSSMPQTVSRANGLLASSTTRALHSTRLNSSGG